MSDEAKQSPTAGTFCWNEMLTTNPEASRAFYTELLGWKTEDIDMGPMGTYTLFKTAAGDDVGGMMAMPPQAQEAGVPSHWISYVAVESVDQSHQRALDLGATGCVPPTDIPGKGRFAVLTDTAGAVFALYSAATG